MDFLWFTFLGTLVGVFMGWIFYEKGYVMIAAILVGILGAWLGGGLFTVFSESDIGKFVFSVLGSFLAILVGIAALIHYVRKK